jgi:hypothetical protein
MRRKCAQEQRIQHRAQLRTRQGNARWRSRPGRI